MISLFFLAFALSFDALGAGFTYGLKNIQIPFLSRLLLCLMSVLCALLATNLGYFLSDILPLWAGSTLSTVILLGLGVYMLLSAIGEYRTPEPVKKKLTSVKQYHWVIEALGLTVTIVRHPIRGDFNHSNTIDAKEAVVLGLALSLDAFGAGIGYGLTSGVWGLPLLAGAFQFVLLTLGQGLGYCLRRKIKTLDTLVSFLPGMILIFLGLLRLTGAF